MKVKKSRRVVLLAAVGVLAAVVLAGAAIAAARYFSQRTVSLSEDELSQWEERLNSPDWAGFLSHMYSDPRYINLNRVLLEGCGLVRSATAQERAAYPVQGQELQLVSVGRDDLDSLLLKIAGHTASDWEHTLSDWTYLPETNSYCRAGETSTPGPVSVTAGQRTGDTLILTLSRADLPQALGVSTLTLTDDKVFSHTNHQYNAVEAMALDLLNQETRTLEDSGAEVLDSYLSLLTCGDWREDGYYNWSVDYRILPADQSDRSAGSAETVNGWRTASGDRGTPFFLVKESENGDFVLMDTVYSGDMPTDTWEQYVDYVLEESLTVDFSSGWPAETASLLRSVASGGDQWAAKPEGVIQAYLLSYGDTMASWEEISLQEEGDNRYLLAQARDKDGLRLYILLLRYGQFTDTRIVRPLGLWQVVGVKILGEPLGEQRAETGREQFVSLPVDDETALSACLAQGGGDYGDYRWSLYIPDTWRRDGDRWYPDDSALNAYLEIRLHDSSYTAAAFYTSFTDSYIQVETNYFYQGGTTLWAKGRSSKTQWTEAYCVSGGDGMMYELVWTYPEENALWGTYMSAVAQTFRLTGSDEAMNLGEKPQAPIIIDRTAANPDDTWLVLDNFSAWRLSDFYAPYLRQVVGETSLTGTKWVCTIPGDGGTSIELFFDSVDVAQTYATDVDAYQREDGLWYTSLPLWLAAEHDGNRILSVRIFPYPYQSAASDELLQAMNTAPSSTGWAVDGYLDPATNTIQVRN